MRRMTVFYPNVPIVAEDPKNVPFGKFLEKKLSEGDVSDPSLASVSARDMYLPNFSLRIMEGSFANEAVFVNRDGEGLDLLGSCFFFRGNVSSQLTGGPETVVSYNRTHNFKYDPNNEYIHVAPAGRPFHFVHFSVSRDHFNSFLPEGERWADVLKEKVNRRERILGERFCPISLLQERALENILNCPLEGRLGLAMIETSITQLIILQLYALFNNAEFLRYSQVPKRDLEAIHMVREHVSATFLDDHSVEDLARHFGMNSNKLMGLFKRLFGKTIFEYIAELRMDHARALLREEGITVAQVARRVGYKNPNHFSTAFKKRFDISPSEFR